MDIEQKVTCHKCLTQFYMGVDTHTYVHDALSVKSALGGMCPHCNAYVTIMMHPDRVRSYPAHGGLYWDGNKCSDIREIPYYPGDGSC